MNVFQKAKCSMMRFMVCFMPSCADISALVSEGFDHPLSLHQRLSIRFHVSLCRFCRRYEKQLHQLQHGFSGYADPDKNAVECSLSSECRERLNRALEHASK